MRILFSSNTFPNPLNPVNGTFNLALMRAVAEQHDVHVVSPVSWVAEAAARLRCGQRMACRLTRVAARLTAEFPRFYYPPRLFRSHYGQFLWWSVRATMLARLNSFRPDAIVSFWVHPDGEVAVRTARLAGVPSVQIVGGSDVLVVGQHGQRKRAVQRVLEQADAIVPVSLHLANRLRQDGIPESKLHVMHTGVNRQLFSPGDRQAARARLGLPVERPVLVAVGRLVPVKGFDVLIDACGGLVARNIPIACYVLGSGPLTGALSRQIRDLGLSDHVFLRGPQSQELLPDWYRAADLTVLTSHSEGIPNVLNESICCGTPFVATNVGGVPEIADERWHTLVPPGNAEAFADAVVRRLRDRPPHDFLPNTLPPSWEEAAARLCGIIEQCRG